MKKTISEYDEHYDAKKEDEKRQRYIRYFRKTEQSRKKLSDSRKAFLIAAVIVVAGAMLAPSVVEKTGLLTSHTAVLCFRILMLFVAAVVAALGYAFRKQEKKSGRKEKENFIGEQEYDRDLKEDLEILKKKSYRIVNERNEDLTYEMDSIRGVKPLMVLGPERNTTGSMFPFRCIAGQDGLLNYSNLKVMMLYKGRKNIYIYTTVLNLCDGISDNDHVYYCEYENIESVVFEDFEVAESETGSEQDLKTVKSFGITAEKGEVEGVFIDVVNYKLQEETGGRCDTSGAENVYNRLKHYNHSDNHPRCALS